jgi:hypothetical protein
MEWNGGRSGRKVRSVVEGSFFTKGALLSTTMMMMICEPWN